MSVLFLCLKIGALHAGMQKAVQRDLQEAKRSKVILRKNKIAKNFSNANTFHHS